MIHSKLRDMNAALFLDAVESDLDVHTLRQRLTVVIADAYTTMTDAQIYEVVTNVMAQQVPQIDRDKYLFKRLVVLLQSAATEMGQSQVVRILRQVCYQFGWTAQITVPRSQRK